MVRPHNPAQSDRDAYRAIAHGTRRGILDRLRDGERTFDEIAKPFGVSQPTLSQHIAILRKAGLIKSRREGGRLYYKLNPTALRPVMNWSAKLCDSKK